MPRLATSGLESGMVAAGLYAQAIIARLLIDEAAARAYLERIERERTGQRFREFQALATEIHSEIGGAR